MQFKDEKIQELAKDFKRIYYEMSENISDEARHMGISSSTNNQYINSEDHHFPLFLAIFHPKSKELARWLCSKVGLNAVESQVDRSELNGSVDDENLDIVARLGNIIKTLKTSKNGEAKMEALSDYCEIEQLIMKAKHEIENLL